MFEDRLSISGQRWIYQKADENQVEFLMQRLGLSYSLCRILASRGITPETAPVFLSPKLQTLMPDPSCLNDMDKVAVLLADVVQKKEKVGIIGDYDVDGATSSAILRLYLESFGLEVVTHIPERDEGYGPSDRAFEMFRAQNIKTVVTTDCGTTAFDVLNKAAQDGFNIIIIDHHEAEAKLPDVSAVVNPKRLDEKNDYPDLKYLAAVGVVFLTLVAINRELNGRGWFETHQKPDLLSFLDLVALGTVCDVVPLLGLNRTTLIDNSGIKEKPDVYHLGFVLGPRINAGGRVGDSSVGHRLLCTKSPLEAMDLAQKLNTYNLERKDIEAHVLSEALEQLEGKPQAYPMAFVYGKTWHQGVIGIVAGKLKERYNLPSFVMSVEADEVKGSARSVKGLDLGALIMSAKEKGLLSKGGGHVMAAGFSLNEDKIEDFKTFVGTYINEKLSAASLVPTLDFDVLLSLGGATLELAEEFQILAPFGTMHPEPRVVIENVSIANASIVGDGHVRCLLSADRLTKAVKAICFKCADNAIGQAMLSQNEKRYNVLGTLRVDEWMNKKTLQLMIEDLMEI